jgi:hypothetical protein
MLLAPGAATDEQHPARVRVQLVRRREQLEPARRSGLREDERHRPLLGGLAAKHGDRVVRPDVHLDLEVDAEARL